MEWFFECMGMDIAKGIFDGIGNSFFIVAKSHCEGLWRSNKKQRVSNNWGGIIDRSMGERGSWRRFRVLKFLLLDRLLYIACTRHIYKFAFWIMSRSPFKRREWTPLCLQIDAVPLSQT